MPVITQTMMRLALVSPLLWMAPENKALASCASPHIADTPLINDTVNAANGMIKYTFAQAGGAAVAFSDCLKLEGSAGISTGLKGVVMSYDTTLTAFGSALLLINPVEGIRIFLPKFVDGHYVFVSTPADGTIITAQDGVYVRSGASRIEREIFGVAGGAGLIQLLRTEVTIGPANDPIVITTSEVERDEQHRVRQVSYYNAASGALDQRLFFLRYGVGPLMRMSMCPRGVSDPLDPKCYFVRFAHNGDVELTGAFSPSASGEESRLNFEYFAENRMLKQLTYALGGMLRIGRVNGTFEVNRLAVVRSEDEVVPPGHLTTIVYAPNATSHYTDIEGPGQATKYVFTGTATQRVKEIYAGPTLVAGLSYDTEGFLTGSSKPLENSSVALWLSPELKNVMETTSTEGTTSRVLSQVTYNTDGQPTAVVELGIADPSTFEYDSLKRMVAAHFPDGTANGVTESTQINALGNGRFEVRHLSTLRPDDYAVDKYDGFGRILQSESFDGTDTRRANFTYNDQGYLSKVETSLNSTIETRITYSNYDAWGTPRNSNFADLITGESGADAAEWDPANIAPTVLRSSNVGADFKLTFAYDAANFVKEAKVFVDPKGDNLTEDKSRPSRRTRAMGTIGAGLTLAQIGGPPSGGESKANEINTETENSICEQGATDGSRNTPLGFPAAILSGDLTSGGAGGGDNPCSGPPPPPDQPYTPCAQIVVGEGVISAPPSTTPPIVTVEYPPPGTTPSPPCLTCTPPIFPPPGLVCVSSVCFWPPFVPSPTGIPPTVFLPPDFPQPPANGTGLWCKYEVPQGTTEDGANICSASGLRPFPPGGGTGPTEVCIRSGVLVPDDPTDPDGPAHVECMFPATCLGDNGFVQPTGKTCTPWEVIENNILNYTLCGTSVDDGDGKPHKACVAACYNQAGNGYACPSSLSSTQKRRNNSSVCSNRNEKFCVNALTCEENTDCVACLKKDKDGNALSPPEFIRPLTKDECKVVAEGNCRELVKREANDAGKKKICIKKLFGIWQVISCSDVDCLALATSTETSCLSNVITDSHPATSCLDTRQCYVAFGVDAVNAFISHCTIGHQPPVSTGCAFTGSPPPPRTAPPGNAAYCSLNGQIQLCTTTPGCTCGNSGFFDPQVNRGCTCRVCYDTVGSDGSLAHPWHDRPLLSSVGCAEMAAACGPKPDACPQQQRASGGPGAKDFKSPIDEESDPEVDCNPSPIPTPDPTPVPTCDPGEDGNEGGEDGPLDPCHQGVP